MTQTHLSRVYFAGRGLVQVPPEVIKGKILYAHPDGYFVNAHGVRIKHDYIVHYCVANIPGAVPNTSTLALTNATLRYAIALADKGWQQACKDDAALAKGLNIVEGKVVFKAVADVFGLPYEPLG